MIRRHEKDKVPSEEHEPQARAGITDADGTTLFVEPLAIMIDAFGQNFSGLTFHPVGQASIKMCFIAAYPDDRQELGVDFDRRARAIRNGQWCDPGREMG